MMPIGRRGRGRGDEAALFRLLLLLGHQLHGLPNKPPLTLSLSAGDEPTIPSSVSLKGRPHFPTPMNGNHPSMHTVGFSSVLQSWWPSSWASWTSCRPCSVPACSLTPSSGCGWTPSPRLYPVMAACNVRWFVALFTEVVATLMFDDCLSQKGQYARLFWSALLHGDETHLLLNISSFLWKVQPFSRAAQASRWLTLA